jgi:type IV secretion system protein VirB8
VSKNPLKNTTPRDYFNRARTWADDNFSQLQQSRNRYQAAFLLALGLNVATCGAVAVLANYQTIIPLMVHHYDNGVMSVEPLTNERAPLNKTQVESDIVRYIENREAYDITSYRAQFDLVSLLSSNQVAGEYQREQDKSNKDAPINTLSTAMSRRVHVYSINFLDTLIFNEKDLPKNHQNVAEVVFSLTDTDKERGTTNEHHYNALISWSYTKPPESPALRWQNWDGFQVIRYSKQLRNVQERTQ